MQAFARNCRNQLADAKGEAQAANHREARVPMQEAGADSTRSSDEGAVMGLERRGRVRWSYLLNQLETG